MSLLESLEYLWNAGGFGVAIQIDEPLYEDALTSGALALVGGTQIAHVGGVRLDYVGVWYERDENNNEIERAQTLDSFSMPLDLTIQPKQLVTIPFQRALETRHSFSKQYHHLALTALVSITGARDAAVTRSIRHRPIEPIETLRHALVERLHWSAFVNKHKTGETTWYVLSDAPVPEHMRKTIDAYWIVVTPVAVEHGHSMMSPAHQREAAAQGTPFAFRDGTRCAIAIECHVDRDGAGWSGLKKEWAGEDKAQDRYVAIDVESALSRIAAFVEYVHSLGPVR
ncbi:MAG: sporulation protein [Polyangiales bacterium]